MAINKGRKTETIVYIITWTVVVALLVLDALRSRNFSWNTPLDWEVVVHRGIQLIYLVVLFLINNCLLIPRLLLRNKYTQYFILTIIVLMCVWGCQYMQFIYEVSRHSHGPHMPPRFTPLIALPVFIDLICDMLIVVLNLATALLFQRYADRLEHERLLKSNAENSLNYLKAQINPHFYMNMLNNIHGMIEINPAKAQDMVLDMSKLMRYMLYDSSKNMIALSEELAFIRNYLSIMRQRFPESKVRIIAELPDDNAVAGIRIAPLVYLVYIENAFKHGVSYREDSFVSVKVETVDDKIVFSCINSIHSESDNRRSGIGLSNAAERLRLIYGNNYNLDVDKTDMVFSVILTLPEYENKDIDHR